MERARIGGVGALEVFVQVAYAVPVRVSPVDSRITARGLPARLAADNAVRLLAGTAISRARAQCGTGRGVFRFIKMFQALPKSLSF